MRQAGRVARLLLLFVLLPAAELGLLIEIGSRIGTGATLALIVVTGIVGASLARRQGLGVLRVLQHETADARRLFQRVWAGSGFCRRSTGPRTPQPS